MRVCPKCGFVDPPEWRHSKWSYWIDFTEYDNYLKLGLPKLKFGEIYDDGLYLYRRTTKSGSRVDRKAKIDYGEQWAIPMEKRKDMHDTRYAWPHPNQTKLFEVKK